MSNPAKLSNSFQSAKGALCCLRNQASSNNGNAVLVSPRHILTALHCLDLESENKVQDNEGRVATLNLNKMFFSGYDYNKYGSLFNNDLAVVTLNRDIGSHFAEVAEHPFQHGDFFELLTRGTQNSEDKNFLPADKTPAQRVRISFKQETKTDYWEFQPDTVQIREGYSGSPIFNEKGEIISLLQGTSRGENDNNLLMAFCFGGQDVDFTPTPILGANPQTLLNFVNKAKQSLDF